MEHNNIEHIFNWLDGASEQAQHQMNITYLDGLALVLEFLFTQKATEEMTDLLKQQLQKKATEIDIDNFEKEEIRKGIQLAALKGMKGATQQQHLITPDTVAMFVGYLANKLIQSNQQIRLFDPACGTGNLLTAVINNLRVNAIPFGSEVDPSLIKIALMSANLQQIDLELFHQDSLRPFLMEPGDLIVSDLPVGYYPDDIVANDYELKADEGHSYAHHLLIEQSMKYTSPGGYLMFIIPNFLFDSDEASKLNAFIQKNAHILGLVQLPTSIFKTENNAKSIFILQKKGQNTKPPKEALMAKLPSFKNASAMNDILVKINQWFKKEGISQT
ncbi:class I SAM-dependent methyltransferase [Sediminibacillus albus]|uniref:Site-specific DNA-methyltransferase (Adenine-specific) n=1 Tax=Sediminibacillus albus TaxID=407036 RepID=A0A1G9BVF7_9BACI|nr:class I SAM-dependent methyltransferase [Sediminibacillus albus]SDK43426.1 site-specific DNA-methyltransferase (adenine-specific) [Sediminibacillus albus]